MAVPAWVERLRPASFSSPSGVDSDFKIDLLSRIGGKKATNHEILNTDEAIPQDQGNRAEEYPIEAYFTGEDGDQEADAFYAALRERYSADEPGILRHPRWGDIPVMPFEFQQVENLVRGAGIFRVTVTFRPIPQAAFPTADGLDQGEIVADVGDLESTLEEANEGIDLDVAAALAEFGAKIREVTNIINDTLGPIVEGVEDIQDEFRTIQEDIDAAISAGDSALTILSQVNNLIRLPGQIVTSTISKVQSYADMGSAIIDSFIGFFNPNSDRAVQLSQAGTFQSLGAMSAAATAEAALFTEFETRDTAGAALDFINDADALIEQKNNEIYQTLAGAVDKTYAPDHDTWLNLSLIIGKTNAILIDRSFDLKAKQTVILSAPSDPISLTWKYYRSSALEDIEFFIRTNNLQDTEIVEIPSGREIVAYV